MEAKIQISGKGIAKVVGAACMATGVVALGALVVSGAAVGAVVESFKSAKNIVKEAIKKEEQTEAAVLKAEGAENTETPALYSCRVILKEDGAIVDEAEEKFGIRLITCGTNLMILGNAAKEKGVYQDGGTHTAASSKKKEPQKEKNNSLAFNIMASLIGSGMNKAGNSKRVDQVSTPFLDTFDIAGYNYGSGRYPLGAWSYTGGMPFNRPYPWLPGGAGDIAYVNIVIKDENGVVESNRDTTLVCQVTGGVLLRFGSANPCTEESYVTGTCTTYYGRAQAVVYAGQPGEICVKVSGGNDSGEARIVVEEL